MQRRSAERGEDWHARLFEAVQGYADDRQKTHRALTHTSDPVEIDRVRQLLAEVQADDGMETSCAFEQRLESAYTLGEVIMALIEQSETLWSTGVTVSTECLVYPTRANEVDASGTSHAHTHKHTQPHVQTSASTHTHTYIHTHVLPYCTVLYCTVLYSTVQYCTVLHCTVLCYTVLYCTVLYQ